MIAKNGILIKNIFHMLSYAFKGLRHKSFDKLSEESFEHIEDLMAAVLLIGMSQLVKRGMHRDYLPFQEDIQTIRGRIYLPKTIRLIARGSSSVNCDFDEFSIDNLFNRILKATATHLIHKNGVREENRVALHRVLLFFAKVSFIELENVCWEKVKLDKRNRLCELLLNVCKFTYFQCLFTENRGSREGSHFEDCQSLSALYQTFLLEYFREHHKQLKPHAYQIPWHLTGKEEKISFLPSMQTDVVLTGNREHLIIDAKFYKKTLQSHWDKRSFHSSNLYQIFTYVQNYRAEKLERMVSGMLLYADRKSVV